MSRLVELTALSTRFSHCEARVANLGQRSAFMVGFLQTYSKEIVSILVPFVSLLLAWVFRARVKLIWSVTNSQNIIAEAEVLENDKPVKRSHIVKTASIFMKNTGREPARNVDLVFNWRPQYFNIWPQRHYEQKENPDGRFIIQFASLAPKEFVGLELLAMGNLPELIQVRSDEAVAKNVSMVPQLEHPRWKLMMVAYLMVAGFVATIYIAISLLQILVVKGPIWFGV